MRLHHAVSIIGGFMGGYAIFNHCDIFGNAQTGNLIKLVLSACSGQWESILYLICAFFTYAAANVFYAVARRYWTLSMKIVSMIVTAIVIPCVGLLSLTGQDYPAVMPLFFFAPVQWNAFKTAGGNSSSTIFSSNNVRQAVLLTTKYCMDKDKEALRNARFYWATLLCFHIGVAVSCLLSLLFASQSIWFCYLFLIAAGVCYYRYQEAKMKNVWQDSL